MTRGQVDGERELPTRARSAALAGVPAALWSAARAAPRRLLALDYDGTLAPFHDDPLAARLPPLTRMALERVVHGGHTAVAILSGRPAADAAALVAGLRVPVVGEHGWSCLYPDGGLLRYPLSLELVRALDAAQRLLEQQLAPAHIERKRTSIAVHTRALEPAAAKEAEAAARRLVDDRLADPRWGLLPVAGGVELRVAGRHKGSAINELARRVGAGVFVVAVGDDDSDEEAFRAATQLGGWGIRVGPARGGAARAHLPGPAEVATFLDAWRVRVDEELSLGRDAAPRH